MSGSPSSSATSKDTQDASYEHAENPVEASRLNTGPHSNTTPRRRTTYGSSATNKPRTLMPRHGTKRTYRCPSGHKHGATGTCYHFHKCGCDKCVAGNTERM